MYYRIFVKNTVCINFVIGTIEITVPTICRTICTYCVNFFFALRRNVTNSNISSYPHFSICGYEQEIDMLFY